MRAILATRLGCTPRRCHRQQAGSYKSGLAEKYRRIGPPQEMKGAQEASGTASRSGRDQIHRLPRLIPVIAR